jgi:hypothetical protein
MMSLLAAPAPNRLQHILIDFGSQKTPHRGAKFGKTGAFLT